MKSTFLIFVILCIFLSTCLTQTENNNFRNISSENGLSSNNIKSLAQDSTGLIWIGTNKGLNCYNGYDIKTYYHNPNDSGSINDNYITKVFVTNNGQLIVGTCKGLCLYNKMEDSFNNYYFESQGKESSILNYINDIVQDNNNKLWIATSEGLCCFDLENHSFSKHFVYSVLFQLNDDIYLKLRQLNIPDYILQKLFSLHTKFFKDHDSLSTKLIKLIGETDYKKYASTIIKFAAQNDQPFQSSSINTLEIDDSNRIWLGLSNGHIIQTSIYNKNYKMAFYNKKSDIESTIFSIVVVKDYVWWSSISNGQIFDIKNWNIITPQNIYLQKLLSDRSLRFLNSGSNIIWISSEQGLFEYNKSLKTIVHHKNLQNNYISANSDFINELFLDKQNNLWIGTDDGGVYKEEKTKYFQKFIKTSPEQNAKTDNKVTAVYVDNNQNTWLGYYTGGIDIFNSNGELIQNFYHNPDKKGSIGNGTIFSILEDKSGQLWVSSYFGGLQKFHPNNKSFSCIRLFENKSSQNHTRHIICDSSNNLWVNTFGCGFFKIDYSRENKHHFHLNNLVNGKYILNDWISCLYENKDGQIVFSTDNCLFQLSQHSESIYPLCKKSYSFDYKVNCIFEDSKDNLFVGTSFGLYLITVNQKDNSNPIQNSILSGNYINDILEDDNGNLWVSSDNGLFEVKIPSHNFANPKEITVKQYLHSDGLPSNNFISGARFKTPNDKLLFGTKNGVVAFYPDSITENTNEPDIVFTDFKLFNKSIIPGKDSFLKHHISQTKEIVLPYNQNFMSFEFAAINFINTEANQYAFKMVGVDNSWNYVGNKREANYTKLNHGNYVFRVKASNNDGIWNNKGISLNINILPPFWKTKLAIVFYLLIISFMLLCFFLLIRFQEKNKAELKLERLNIYRVKELNNLKLQFFTNISHELRTPLTLILGPLENLIQSGKGSSELIQLIYINAKKLQNLINQLMDIRKLNSGKIQLRKEKCDIVELLGTIVNNFNYQCKIKNINLIFRKNIQILETFVDTEKLEIIINNLLSNAIKHTPANGLIKVTINSSIKYEYDSTNTDNDFFSISVKDNGDGIAESELNNVFDRFYQSSQRYEGGSGIGLTLVKEFTEMHNGKVTVNSILNMGSEFTVYFPINLKKSKNSMPESINYNDIYSNNQALELFGYTEEFIGSDYDKCDIYRNEVSVVNSSPSLILVVEDNDEVKNYIISELKAHYRIISARNGKEALNLIIDKFPDIIISDIMMPEMNGFELSERLKSDIKTCHIPIILLTAYTSENTNIAGYELGAECFMAKPFSPKILRTRIKNILENRERLKKKFSNILYSIHSDKLVNSADDQFIKIAIKIVEDNLVNEDFNIEFFCREIGYSRTALYSKIKTLTNQSVSEFIKLIRLKNSIELFNSGQKSIKEVAYSVGFKTHSHFTRCFNEEFDMSPTDYISKIYASDIP